MRPFLVVNDHRVVWYIQHDLDILFRACRHARLRTLTVPWRMLHLMFGLRPHLRHIVWSPHEHRRHRRRCGSMCACRTFDDSRALPRATLPAPETWQALPSDLVRLQHVADRCSATRTSTSVQPQARINDDHCRNISDRHCCRLPVAPIMAELGPFRHNTRVYPSFRAKARECCILDVLSCDPCW